MDGAGLVQALMQQARLKAHMIDCDKCGFQNSVLLMFIIKVF
jgi:hypothetical protein